MKKLIYSVPALAAVASFASTGEGAGDAAEVNWTSIANSAEDSLSSVVSGLAPMVGAVVALVAGCRLLAKLINRAVGK